MLDTTVNRCFDASVSFFPDSVSSVIHTRSFSPFGGSSRSNHHSTALLSYPDGERSIAMSRNRLTETGSFFPALAQPQTQPQTQDSPLRSHRSQVDVLTGMRRGSALAAHSRSTGDRAMSRRSVSNGRTSSTLYGSLDFSDDFNPTRPGSFKDDYLLSRPTGGRVQINLDSSGFDTYLQIVDSRSGRVLAFDDDGGTGSNSQLSVTLQAGVNYIVRATSYDAYETGQYSLSANLVGDSPPAPPSSGFNSTIGYGLVDAAAAVARSINTNRFSEVTNLGGNNWGTDLVNAPEAWARGYTGRNITVAVIDSGVDITHPDLRNNIWTNSREVANDGIDNDRNGYVDDLFGWNFGMGQNNNNVMPGTADPDQGHGTHVAGSIAAANNGVGLTGVAPNARIMALRLGNVSGGQFTNAGSLAAAIRYAVDNGARVINMSLGWSDSPELRSALAYAASRNVITVSAAGNERSSAPGTPANYATQYGLSVGAVDRNRAFAYGFSNRAGSNSQMSHVVAPGVSVYSTVPNNRYEVENGTSMASPHVAGVVALMLSANPNLTHSQVRQIITETATTQGISTAAIQTVRHGRIAQVTLGTTRNRSLFD